MKTIIKKVIPVIATIILGACAGNPKPATQPPDTRPPIKVVPCCEEPPTVEVETVGARSIQLGRVTTEQARIDRLKSNSTLIDRLARAMSETPQQGPLTNASNLRVRTDGNGYLVATMAAYTAPDGPLTNLGNIRLRTDANGYLLVTTSPTAGSTFYAGGGTAAAPSITFANDTDSGVYLPDANTVAITVGGTARFVVDNGGADVRIPAGTFSFGGGPTSSGDLALARDAAHILAQRSGTNPQTARWYNTTDGTNKEYIQLQFAANVATLQAVAEGTGTVRSLNIIGNSNTSAVYATASNCASSASPAVCGSASAGASTIAAAATSKVVNTTAVTANSQIFITQDQSLGTRLSVTCNTQSDLVVGTPEVSARVAGTSFTVIVPVAPTTDPLCFNYLIIN